MKKTFLVAKYTVLEVYRSKVMLSILFIAVGLALVSYVTSEFAYGAPAKVVLDIGFGLTSLSNLVMAVFIGSTLLGKEIENRTLYMILSRPISRGSFLLGKVIGLSNVLIINTFLLSLLSAMIFKFLGGTLSSLMFWASWFSLFEALVIMLFSILFSLMTSTALAIIFTIVIWVVGHSMSSTFNLFAAKSSAVITYTLKGFAFFIPDLEKINLKDMLLYQQSLPSGFLWHSQLYITLYIIALLFLISFIFKNKNLD